MHERSNELRSLTKPQLSVALAQIVRECMLPEDGKWTIEAGRDAIEVLLIAARMAYPTSADIEEFGTISEVGTKLAEGIENDLKDRTI